VDQLLVLVVIVPLLVAAAVTACGPLLRSGRRILDVVAILTAACVAVMLGIIMIRTAGGDQVYWFAGFRPARGVSIGIDFEVQPLSAGLACLAAVLVTAAMTFSWRYFERVATYYHALMLTFLAGIVGFCLTGDLFDLFVWFELMGVSAYALTAYRPEERGPIQGALNFAITNSVGAYLSLSGIGLIYGRTGALNMAQIGASIAKHPADRLVVVAFLLVIAGLLIKSAIVPFHFWLADAHAVAPTPVCVLFSGVMVELGLYGIARVYWSVFGQALGHRAAISHVLLALGLLTAVIGALFCFRERHIKRMLAFSTISHAGMFLIGIALLTPLGLAGAAVYVIGHGLVKGALFLCTGIVLHRLGSVNEPWLHGRGRPLRVTGVVFTLAGLGLADLPPFATFLGKGWIEASAGLWLIPILLVCSSLAGGAVLRVAGGVFYGLGDPPAEDPQMARAAAEETSETTGGKDRTPLTMIIPPVILVIAAIAVGLVGLAGPLGTAVQSAAVRFEDQAGYNATVLRGAHLTHPVALFAAGSTSVSVADVLAGLGSVIGALILAWMALYWRRLPLLRGYRPNASLAGAARRFQSGVVNDYVTWTVIGLACLGGVFAAIIGLSEHWALVHAHQLQAKVANPVEDAVQIGLIVDLADEDGLLAVRFQGKTLESGPEVLGQAAPDRDPVPGRLYVPSDALWSIHFLPVDYLMAEVLDRTASKRRVALAAGRPQRSASALGPPGARRAMREAPAAWSGSLIA
jgi:multicomponent Na+:H+ antiporter subunit D